jgi:uncharacterized protein YodC (DUF2158 family)
MIQFEKGDKVRLRSIGPVMEVIAVEKNALNGKIIYIECEWVSPKQKHYKERFKPEEVVLVRE